MVDRTRGSSKDVGDLLRQLAHQGFTYTETAKCRYKVYGPDGAFVTVLGKTSGDWRSLRNTLAWLRKAGFTRPRG